MGLGWIGELGVEIMRFINKITLKPSKEIKKVVAIYDEMHKILEETKVQRFLVFKAHNGGGLIKPSTPLYVSVLHEDYSTPFKSVKDTYQQVMIDGEYIRILDKVCQDKMVRIKTRNLKSSLLKDIYEAEGVQYSEIYFLGQNRKNLYFTSTACAWENGWEDNVEQKVAIKLAINHIRNNIM
jgi:hypothetical protein